MYCYVRNALSHVRWLCLVMLWYVFLLSSYLGGRVIVQPLLQKKVLFVLLMKKTPRPNNLEFSKWNLFKRKFCWCWYFLALECFTLEIKPAQPIDAHSLTARLPQSPCALVASKKNRLVSSCANPIKVMFLSIDHVPNLHNLSGAHPNQSHLTTSPFTWIW